MITHTSIIVASKNHAEADLDGETVLLAYESGVYYGLNDVGSRIWDLVRTPRSVSDVCQQLCREYAVNREGCLEELVRLLGDLHEAGLLEILESTDA